jgi:hypothetical protein
MTFLVPRKIGTFAVVICDRDDQWWLDELLSKKFFQTIRPFVVIYVTNRKQTFIHEFIIQELRRVIDPRHADGIAVSICIVRDSDWSLVHDAVNAANVWSKVSYITKAKRKDFQKEPERFVGRETHFETMQLQMERTCKNPTLLPWIRNADRLGIRAAAESLLRGIHIAPTQTIASRVILNESQIQQYGRPAYFVFRSGRPDSDSVLFAAMSNNNKSSLDVFQLEVPAFPGITSAQIDKAVEAKPLDPQQYGVFVLVDEALFSGNKFKTEQYAIFEQFALSHGKQWIAKFAYGTDTGIYAANNHISANFRGLHVEKDGNLLAPFSEKNPMVFAHDPGNPGLAEDEAVIRHICVQLSDSESMLGYGGFGSLLVAQGLTPDNTLPLIWVRGKNIWLEGKTVRWIPLLGR